MPSSAPHAHLVCSPELQQLLCADAATKHKLPAQAYVVHVVVGMVQGQEVKEALAQAQLINNSHIAGIDVKDASQQLEQDTTGKAKDAERMMVMYMGFWWKRTKQRLCSCKQHTHTP